MMCRRIFRRTNIAATNASACQTRRSQLALRRGNAAPQWTSWERRSQCDAKLAAAAYQSSMPRESVTKIDRSIALDLPVARSIGSHNPARLQASRLPGCQTCQTSWDLGGGTPLPVRRQSSTCRHPCPGPIRYQSSMLREIVTKIVHSIALGAGNSSIALDPVARARARAQKNFPN